jgi:hypothetical protein
MTIRVDLNPETEARLIAQARAKGLPLEKVAELLLNDALNGRSPSQGRLRVEEFHRMLSAMAEGSEKLPDLPTKIFSRASFYEDRIDGRDALPRR